MATTNADRILDLTPTSGLRKGSEGDTNGDSQSRSGAGRRSGTSLRAPANLHFDLEAVGEILETARDHGT